MPTDSHRYVLISVSNKTGLIDFIHQIRNYGFRFLASSGSAELLRQSNVLVDEISDITNFPEILGGRVKTLHPLIHGGILHRRGDLSDIASVESHNIPQIDMVIANLYPFMEVVARGADFSQAVENIDIGGCALLRAAAKNSAHVAVICEPQDYSSVAEDLKKNLGETSESLRLALARKAFAFTSAYDSSIANYLFEQSGKNVLFPDRFNISAEKLYDLRYGENNHQQAALYQLSGKKGVAYANQLQGVQMGYNNYIDADCALSLISEFENPACCIVKHVNPCGAAEAFSLNHAWRRALNCDPKSAFGGTVAFNRAVDVELAEQLCEMFLEVLIAPHFSDEALKLFAKKPKLRILATPPLQQQERNLLIHSISGGYLVQDTDAENIDPEKMSIATQRQPSEQEMRDLLFGWRVAKYVKSNAIVIARDGASVGIGAGQMSRVDAASIAIQKAMSFQGAAEAVAASDAFIPFPDSISLFADAGITAIIQPGGSQKDDAVIKAANLANIAMVFTKIRHFRH